MLVHDNLVRYIKFQLRLQQCQGTFPCTFSAEGKLTVVKSQSKLRRLLVKWIVRIVYGLVLWIQLIQERGKESILISLESLVFAIGTVVFCNVTWVFYQRREAFAWLFNLFLQFERRHAKGEFPYHFYN